MEKKDTLSCSLYAQIRDFYLQKINNKELSVGVKLPTEVEIAKVWNTTKMTVRRAMQDLIQSGYLQAKRGVGYFVTHPTLVMETNYITAFSNRKNGVVRTEVLEFYLKKIDIDDIIKCFNSKYYDFWYIKRLRYMNNFPTQLEITYLPYELFPSIKKEDVVFSKYEYISRISLSSIATIDSTFSPLKATKDISNQLKIDEDDALIQAFSIGYLMNGDAFEYVKVYHHPTSCLLHSRIPYI